MVRVTINGTEILVGEGTTLLAAARELQIEIPTLCHDDRLSPYAACGLCVVEAEGAPKLLRACATACADGMVIHTHSRRVTEARKTLLEFLLSNHTGDCRPPCMLACPANTDCQGYAARIAKGEYAEAVKLMKEAHPLPASIGRVCPHPCETECRRQLCEEPVSLAALKYFAADMDLKNKEPYVPEISAPTGKSAAIVGGGPAGLTAAYFLRRAGHEVTVYDSMPEMGGLLRYGIPEYRLPKAVLHGEISVLLKMGILFKNNTALGKDITLGVLRGENDAVIIATGAGKSKRLHCPGEGLEGVWGGIDFLKSGKDISLGSRVAVAGGSNTAIDAARTAVRLGAPEVYVLYRRTREEMPAEPEEIREAEAEGVIFKFLVNPLEIRSDGQNEKRVQEALLQKMTLGEPDASGRRSPVPVPGAVETLQIDTFITAIGQDVDLTGLEDLNVTRRGALDVDSETFFTGTPGVFAIGDVTGKSAYAIEAIGHARKAAAAVHRFLSGGSSAKMELLPPILVKDQKTAEDFHEPYTPRERSRQREASEARGDFLPTHYKFTGEQAKREASRCLSCGCGDFADCKLIKYANEYAADPNAFSGVDFEKSKHEMDESGAAFVRDANKCVLCGLCVRYCEEVEGRGLLGIAFRGFSTVASPAFGRFENAGECGACGRCVEVCPTGALQKG
ncbi:MAG: FAD-dependent oxidoreductase [Clostridiales bacterium]|jgi:formate dehydrogenase major subunit|nr:FAD-dependent oxidoreductase [Clostridiales bacterium]